MSLIKGKAVRIKRNLLQKYLIGIDNKQSHYYEVEARSEEEALAKFNESKDPNSFEYDGKADPEWDWDTVRIADS